MQSLDKNNSKRTKKLRQAIIFAKKWHHGQKRHTGEQYVAHPKRVLQKLLQLENRCQFQFKIETLQAAIFHDLFEEAPDCFNPLVDNFGIVVAQQIYGLTKLPAHRMFKDQQDRFRAYFEHFKIHTKLVPEILVIKLADQLDNLQTLSVFPESKQQQILAEIFEYFLPFYQQQLLLHAKKPFSKILQQLIQEAEEFQKSMKYNNLQAKNTC